uniref:helix-turn-helix domain-containing protein n=1 Tax=Longibaculum muris TaxID=1796628 RepID=UPI003AB244D7
MTLTELRKSKNLTQAQAAKILGVPLRTYQNWEIGTRKTPAWSENLLLEKLAKYKTEAEKEKIALSRGEYINKAISSAKAVRKSLAKKDENLIKIIRDNLTKAIVDNTDTEKACEILIDIEDLSGINVYEDLKDLCI